MVSTEMQMNSRRIHAGMFWADVDLLWLLSLVDQKGATWNKPIFVYVQ